MPTATEPLSLIWRETPSAQDSEGIRRLVESTGFFSEAEVAIAVELVDERLDKGPASGYHFLFAETRGTLAGYACYGPAPGIGICPRAPFIWRPGLNRRPFCRIFTGWGTAS